MQLKPVSNYLTCMQCTVEKVDIEIDKCKVFNSHSNLRLEKRTLVMKNSPEKKKLVLRKLELMFFFFYKKKTLVLKIEFKI